MSCLDETARQECTPLATLTSAWPCGDCKYFDPLPFDFEVISENFVIKFIYGRGVKFGYS